MMCDRISKWVYKHFEVIAFSLWLVTAICMVFHDDTKVRIIIQIIFLVVFSTVFLIYYKENSTND